MRITLSTLGTRGDHWQPIASGARTTVNPRAVMVVRSLAAAATVAVVLGAASAASAAKTERPAGPVVPDEYIVVLEPRASSPHERAERVAREHGGRADRTYAHVIQGFSGRFPEGRLAALRRDPDVRSVEPDRFATVSGLQADPVWNLDRIDQRSGPVDGVYDGGNEGAGVHAYVVDTGVRATHAEFAGRMGGGFDAITSGGTANDCHGHGTHVAGTIGGTTYGVAGEVTLHPVRVLRCDGTAPVSVVLAGLDWVKRNHVSPAVVNMSLGGPRSDAVNIATANLVAAGVIVVAAGGNATDNACEYSPASEPTAVTVGATNGADQRADFSNFGRCLDLFAPGVEVRSAWSTDDTAANTINGTSMAAPHVAGAAARVLSAAPGATPREVRDMLVATGTTAKVTGAGLLSPDVLLFAGWAPVDLRSRLPLVDDSPAAGGDGDGALEPGESFRLRQPLRNFGSAAITGIGAVLEESHADLVLGSAGSVYPDVAPSRTATNATPFSGTLSATAECGAPLPMTVRTTTGQGPLAYGISVPTGAPGPARAFDTAPDAPIPDDALSGRRSTIEVAGMGAVLDLDVSLGITHSWDNDVNVVLTSPQGTSVLLVADRGGSGNDFTATMFDDEATTAIGAGTAPFTGRFRPEHPLSAFDGEAADGTWTLTVVDDYLVADGRLKSWGLRLAQPACSAPTSPAVVSGVTVSARSRTVTLNWEPAVRALRYEVFRLTTNGTQPQTPIGAVDDTRYTATDQPPGRQCYVIRGVNAPLTGATSAPVCVETTTGQSVPPPPGRTE